MKKALASLCGAALLTTPVLFPATASAGPINLGSVTVPGPDLAPIPVGTPFGVPAAALPPLPYPFQWAGPALPAPDAFGGRTLVVNCQGGGEKMPGMLLIDCKSGNLTFGDIHWDSWTDAVATGTATRLANECRPSCATGNFQRTPVRIVLHEVRVVAGVPAFTWMTVDDGTRVVEQGISGNQYSR